MKCEKCDSEATVFIQRNINGAVSEQHLCAACARKEMGEGDSSLEKLVGPMFSKSIPAGIFHVLGGIPSFGTAAMPSAPAKSCPVCGTSYEAFRKTGLVGCASCYDAFADRMEQIFARVQASSRHTGRKLLRTGTKKTGESAASAIAAESAAVATAEGISTSAARSDDGLLRLRLAVQDLRSQLRQAIEKEDYEEAAKLRDRVYETEAEIAAKGESA